ncbi:hypothetical protein FDUTEX481_09169 [Tolypothrix sp. PCC 7601]|nr:hypothetical protein FDUTEX481_09169 [Tolypothrix sp. PCC 7601]
MWPEYQQNSEFLTLLLDRLHPLIQQLQIFLPLSGKTYMIHKINFDE